ncbi:MAG: HAD-IA family hydrolase [Acidimicrobiales bacterium]
MNPNIKAVLFDFGGVISSSPFEAFAHYEESNGLPTGFIRGLNATNPDRNAWAHLERGDVSFEEFCTLFEDEAIAAGHTLKAAAVMELLSGEIRPAIVRAITVCHQSLKTALLTNNFITTAPGDGVALNQFDGLFDVIVQSSTAGVRKPDPRFYELACTELGIQADEAVFLDDLGINLKPARAMGMTTIKVNDPVRAIAELADLVGLDLT